MAERAVSDAEAEAVGALIERRITTRDPAAYLTGEAWLQGVPCHIDRPAIAPRSFIAELIARGGTRPRLSAATHARLDLCTGNGSLAAQLQCRADRRRRHRPLAQRGHP